MRPNNRAREALLVWLRERWKKVCARGAWWALLRGPSISPLASMREITAVLDVKGFIVRPAVLAPWCRKTAVAILALCAWNAARAESMAWALAYEGKDNQSFLYDARVVLLILRDLGITSSSLQMPAFHGVPAPVNVVARRYVWSSSCEVHQCPFNRGFFWLDSDTGETLAARATISYPKNREYRELRVLVIGGSSLSIESVSPEALQTLRNWIVANDLRFDTVEYRSSVVNHNSGVATLDQTEYSAPASHPPAR